MAAEKPRSRTEWCPKLKANVLLYGSEAGLHLLTAPSLKKCEQLRLLSASEFTMLKQCDGTASVVEIARRLSLTPEETAASLQKWSGEETGVLENGPTGPNKDKKYMNLLAAIQSEWWSAKTLDGDTHDVSMYHRTGIVDAHQQFEAAEVTLSHAYCEPHPALGNLSYGQRLAERLHARGVLRGRILEVGGGTGLVAKGILDWLRDTQPEVYSEVSYTHMDLSPTLLRAQRQALEGHAGRIASIEGNVEKGLPHGSFDLILLNEMIADLSIVRLKKTWVESGYSGDSAEVEETLELIDTFALDVCDASSSILINAGAIRVLSRLPQALAPCGSAFISEYGSPHLYPRRVDLRGHTEHTVHFGHLVKVADRLNLSPKLENLSTFLGFDDAVEVIRDPHYLIEHLLAFLGRNLPNRAYTKEMLKRRLEDFDCFVNLQFVPVGGGESYLDPAKFWMLSVSRLQE